MRLFVFVLLAAVIISCNSTGNDSSYPMRIGTWELSSSTEANWVGKTTDTNTKSKVATTQAIGDTLVFSTPEKTVLRLWSEGFNSMTGELIVNLLYVDSTITKSYGEENNLNLSFIRTEFDGADIGPRPYRLNKRYVVMPNDILESHLQFLYTCGHDKQDINNIHINLLKQAESYPPPLPDADFTDYIFRTITLEITGFKDILESEFCSDPEPATES